MTYAELLRKHATDATNEGGMWFSGEYMTMLASMAESVEAENAKLREQIETLVMYVESDGTRYWVDDDGNQHFDHAAVKDDA